MGTSRKTAPAAGRMIAWTAVAALACWGAALSMVRAVAQQTAPPPEVAPQGTAPPQEAPPQEAPPQEAPPTEAAPASPEGPDTNEETPSDRARAPVTLDELPQFRDSADNNISLPVDI